MLAPIDNSRPWASILISMAMLLVWITYLQVLFSGYWRERRVKVIINQGAGASIGATCFVSNMSQETIYLESIVVRIGIAGRYWEREIADLELSDREGDSSDPRQMTLQGPLRAGDFIAVGSFRRLAEHVLDPAYGNLAPSLEGLRARVDLEVQVFADYASEDLPVSVKRRFELLPRDGTLWLHSDSATRSHRIAVGGRLRLGT